MKKIAALVLVFVIIILSPLLLYKNKTKIKINAADHTKDSDVNVTVSVDGEIKEMSLDYYLFGVLVGEMPVTFPMEALKAQAVAARTYTVSQMLKKPKDNHPDAQVCTDSTCCKAYLDPMEALYVWGEEAFSKSDIIRQAISDTDGMIIVYEEEPITAVFFSTSWGHTLDASLVWGNSVPYLVSVKSEGEEISPRYRGQVVIKNDDFKDTVLKYNENARFNGSADKWIKDIKRNYTGAVNSASIGGITLSGREIRTLFGLNSVNFEVSFKDGEIIFDTLGFGHEVGMSQYGACVMAQNGKNFNEIITHYYTDVEIVKYKLT